MAVIARQLLCGFSSPQTLPHAGRASQSLFCGDSRLISVTSPTSWTKHSALIGLGSPLRSRSAARLSPLVSHPDFLSSYRPLTGYFRPITSISFCTGLRSSSCGTPGRSGRIAPQARQPALPNLSSRHRVPSRTLSTRHTTSKWWDDHHIAFIVAAMVIVNISVFLTWTYAEHLTYQMRDPRLLLFMLKNFASIPQNLHERRWWTLLTSSFSHADVTHLLFNMVTFTVLAPPMLALTGPAAFLGLYFGSSILTNGASLIARWYALPPEAFARSSSIGASGSVYALMTTFACVHPKAIFYIFFVLPVPAWAVVGGVFAYDAYRTAVTPLIRTDSAGHVGGIIAGILFWRFKLRSLRI